MKRLIAISVVFALVAGAVFAVDVTGTVIGTVNVMESTTEKGDKVRASGGMDRIRLDGAGETGDGDFGGYVRFQYGNKQYMQPVDWDPEPQPTGADFVLVDAAYAWWKPLDQFKLIIGQQSDGFWGKEGVTGWGFNQIAQDTSVAINPGIWYGPYWGSTFYAGGSYMHSRYVFFEGWLGYGAGMEITPADMATINIAIPFIDYAGYEAADVYKAAIAQVSLNLDFGNIAITYDGGGRAAAGVGSGGAIYAFAGLSVIENLGIDVGFSFHMKGDATKSGLGMGQTEDKQPIGVGVGLKYTADSFGVKFKTTAALAGEDKATYINTSVMPYFTLSDNLAAFVNVGLGMIMPDEGDNVMGWYFNPYLRVGGEWGPSFYAGIKVSSDGVENGEGKKIISWAVPIALVVSF